MLMLRPTLGADADETAADETADGARREVQARGQTCSPAAVTIFGVCLPSAGGDSISGASVERFLAMTDYVAIIDRHIDALANGDIQNFTLEVFKREAEICCSFDFNTAKKLRDTVKKLIASGADPKSDGTAYCGVLYASMLLQLRDEERLRPAALRYVDASSVLSDGEADN